MTAGGRVRETTSRGGPSGRARERRAGVGGVDEALGGERHRADRARSRRRPARRGRPSRRGRARRTRGCRRAGRRSRRDRGRGGRDRRPTPPRGRRRRVGPVASRSRMSDVGPGVARRLELRRVRDRRPQREQQLARRLRDRRRRAWSSLVGASSVIGASWLRGWRRASRSVAGRLAGGEVGERHAFEDVAEAGPYRDPDVGEPGRGPGVGDGLRRVAVDRGRGDRRPPGSRRPR